MIHSLSSSEYARPLEIALKAARQAGRILVKRRDQTREIKIKGLRDIVTDADFAANRAVRAALEKAFPDHAILSEEDPHPGVSVQSAENIWVLDPLDGTTNYSRGYPVYAVSLALARRGQPQVGVIYDPLRDECYHAVRGHGAFLNDTPIRVSQVHRFEDAMLGYELSHEQGLRERGLNWFARLVTPSMTARIGGSAALSLCYIAAGRMDGYFHLSLNPWDVAAGILLVREAGGRVTHLDGSAATLRGGGYLAGNRKFLPVMLKAIRELQAGEQP
ncbi:MAG: inositol monophosphatase family protein [Anaerolineae bacterium]